MAAAGSDGVGVDVLVAGAGPTGLALAAHVHAHGACVRIVERRPERRRDSPALVMQPRTLEVLEPLGLADRLVARGMTAADVHLHFGARMVSVRHWHAALADTAYPYVLAIPQPDVEAVLEEHLDREGVRVERDTELLSFEQDDGGVACELGTPGGRERARARYLVGCDGARSTVRRIAGIAFPGSAYPASVLVADLEVDPDPPRGGLHGFFGPSGILFLFPLPGQAAWRLVLARRTPPRRGRGGAPATDRTRLEDLRRAAAEFPLGPLRLRDPEWLSERFLRRGQASRYRSGRVFLAGDAAHVHSPAGAQGMNTGIQDAVNLGWKLALAARGLANDALLDSYERERWPVARWTRRLTDPAFVVETSAHLLVRLLRQRLAPALVPALMRAAPMTVALRVVGGFMIRYRRSPAVAEAGLSRRGGVRAGDRLPNAHVARDGASGWLHRFLTPPGFQLLLCGPPGVWDPHELARLRTQYAVVLSVHRVGQAAAPGVLHDLEGETLTRLGTSGPAQYLIRPDGYVAFRAPGRSLVAVRGYLEQWFPGA